MKIWHVNINEKEKKVLSSGIFSKLVVLAETFEDCEKKIRNYMKQYEMSDNLCIGKIEFIEEVDIE